MAPKNLSLYFQGECRLSLSRSFSVFPLQKQKPSLHPPSSSSQNEKAKRMVKDVATYFSMTLGAFVFWQSLDEVHVRIALHQDEKVTGKWEVGDATELGRKSGVGEIPYLSDFSYFSPISITVTQHHDSHRRLISQSWNITTTTVRLRTPPPPSLLHCHTGFLPSFSQTHFASLSSTAVGMSLTHSPPQPLPGVLWVLYSLTLTDEDLDTLGFEKVTEEFIGECKLEALLLCHKKTGA
ncbi:hypothetical protein DVH24_039138 [Malus domestica]|uniref:Uncharacterized protein n=1 Tax=Malus domestica TaxID=3750 RepID=A0A498KEN7_MALDO|nr:hypothetical protein DVH24_039138 [Malus domestica]